MDFNAVYIDRRTWLLDQLEKLNLSVTEAMILLLIDFGQGSQQPVSHEWLAAKLKMSVDDIETSLDQLSAKGYLQFQFDQGQIRFRLDGLFQQQNSGIQQTEVLSLFERAMGRTLSSMEMERILKWENDYGKAMVNLALREALAFEARSLNYVEKVLVSWQKKGLTVDDIVGGKR